MKFTLEELKQKSQSRPNGYYDDVLAAATKIDDQMYELSDEAITQIALKWRLPSYAQMIANLANAAQAAISGGLNVRNGDETTAALTICATCPYLVEAGFRCGNCGCYLDYKVQLKDWHCPMNKW